MRNAILSIAGLVSLLAAPVSLSAETYGESSMVAADYSASFVNEGVQTANSAQRVVAVETWIEEWDDASQSWIRVEGSRETEFKSANHQPAERFYAPAFRPQEQVAAAQYGPFKVIDDKRAALVGPTDSMSPKFFDMMLKDYPALGVFEILEGPGTSDDVANLTVGRKIREAGLTTKIGRGGSARSGAVELFLAGKTHTIEDGAEFAVHSWRDNFGREPKDYAADAPENRFYLDYYEEMGMSDEKARAFYDMTNSVPHVSALWLNSNDMRPWVSGMAQPVREALSAPTVAVLSSSAGLAPLADIEAVELGQIAALEITAPDMPQIAYMDVDLLDSGVALP
ncbi:MAG: hypothetical protein ABJ242_02080 [Marinomonas sp.]